MRIDRIAAVPLRAGDRTDLIMMRFGDRFDPVLDFRQIKDRTMIHVCMCIESNCDVASIRTLDNLRGLRLGVGANIGGSVVDVNVQLVSSRVNIMAGVRMLGRYANILGNRTGNRVLPTAERDGITILPGRDCIAKGGDLVAVEINLPGMRLDIFMRGIGHLKRQGTDTGLAEESRDADRGINRRAVGAVPVTGGEGHRTVLDRDGIDLLSPGAGGCPCQGDRVTGPVALERKVDRTDRIRVQGCQVWIRNRSLQSRVAGVKDRVGDNAQRLARLQARVVDAGLQEDSRRFAGGRVDCLERKIGNGFPVIGDDVRASQSYWIVC
jgi:hypothetical protein